MISLVPARSRRCTSVLARVALVVAVALVPLGCTDDGDDATEATTTAVATTAPTSSGPGTSAELPEVDGPFAPGRTQLPGFGEVRLTIVPGPDGEPLIVCVLLAESRPQRARGLMGVTDETLGGYDGMLFVYLEDVEGGFWMRDTLLPLSLAYLDVDGAVVDTVDMEPCPPAAETCPTYPPSGPYRLALEVPQGGLARLNLEAGSDARVEVGGTCRSG